MIRFALLTALLVTASLAHAQSATEANRAVVEAAYADFASGDVEAFLARLDSNVTWTVAEGYPYAGTYVGPDALMAGLIARIGAEWDDYTAVPTTTIAEGDRVVALGAYGGTYKATGRRVDTPFAHMWQLEDGVVVRFRTFTDGPPWQRAVAPGHPVSTAVMQASADHIAAINRQDADAFVDVFTADAVESPSDGSQAVGRDAIRENVRNFLAAGEASIELDPLEILPLGDGFAYQRAAVTMRLDGAVVQQGIISRVWVETPDGWKIARDTWTSRPSAD